MAGPWRFGSATAGYIDLPSVQRGLQSDFEEQGGSARALDGTLLVQRTGPVKQTWAVAFKPYADGTLWQSFIAMYRAAPSPYEMFDPVTTPNLLAVDDCLGVGWVQSTGTAITASSNMRIALGASVTTAQTAITTSPAAANLSGPIVPGNTYTAGISVENASGATGTFQVFGYTSTPSGTGTQQGSTTNITTSGRYTVTFTAGAGITLVELRAARSAGTFNIVDPSLFPGSADVGKSVRTVRIQPPKLVAYAPFDLTGKPNPVDLTVTLEEV